MGEMIFGTYQKHISYSNDGCVFFFSPFDSPNQYMRLNGNVPKFENKSGLTKTRKYKNGNAKEITAKPVIRMGVELDENGKVVNYVIKDDSYNRGRLLKLGYNPDAIFSDISFHKQVKCKWKEVSKAKNPYNNLEFPIADKYYHNAKGYYQSDERFKAINTEILKKFRARRKDTYTLPEYLDAFREVELSSKAFAKVSNNAILKYFATHQDFTFDGVLVHDKAFEDAQNGIRMRCINNKKARMNFIAKDSIDKSIKALEDEGIILSDEQKECVYDLETNGMTIITGGAGVGKTTVVKGIVRTYESVMSKSGYLLVAPTGKASRRLAHKSGVEAFTIHHALVKEVDGDFVKYHKGNELSNTLVICDESSMNDTFLMYDLMSAFVEGAKIVFVGDKNQLEPVGIGSPFHELVDSGLVRVIELTKNFRQEDNDIDANAKAVLNGEDFFDGKGVEQFHISLKDIDKYIEEDVVNITPYNKICHIINQTYFLNHKEDEKFHKYFYVGAKVLFTVNTDTYNNGDTGVIQSFDTETNHFIVKLDDCDVIIDCNEDDLENIKFGYALTVHKTQGSEYDVVKIFLPEDKEKNPFAYNPNLLYTASTRAKKKLQIYYYSE